ncbi:MAG TPA: hypothetical protein HPP94_06920 [Desulfuromonadales bacterium]|nr:hypothetical protein [Desulfuromonadales bacterium]
MIMLNPFAAHLRYEPLEALDEPLDRPALRNDVQALHDHVQMAVELMKSITGAV